MVEVEPSCEPLRIDPDEGHFTPDDWTRQEDGSVILTREEASRLALTFVTLIGHARCD